MTIVYILFAILFVGAFLFYKRYKEDQENIAYWAKNANDLSKKISNETAAIRNDVNKVQYSINLLDANTRAFEKSVNEKFNHIDAQLKDLELNQCRTQLLVLLSDYSDRVDELLKLGEHYFYDLHGDQYLTTLYKDWLDTKNINYPDWFDPNI